MFKLRVLLADDQLHGRRMTTQLLESCGGLIFRPEISEALTAEEAVELARQSLANNEKFDLVILDIHFVAADGSEMRSGHWAADEIRQILPSAQIIIVSSYPTDENLRIAGANKAVTRFFRRSLFSRAELFRAAIWACLGRLHSEHKLLPEDVALHTRSDRMVNYLRGLDQIQPSTSVVIYGETGTGKELSARRLNANARFELGQKDRPFVAVNCAGLSPNLIESELFGHVRGAFTGAHSDKDGYLARANGGDLFLDELQSASLPFQQILMRALQERAYVPVGSTKVVPFDVRIISALNMNLSEIRSSGKLMPDFVARLRQDMLEIPALRERPEDFQLLIEVAKIRAREKHSVSDKEFSPDAVEFLKSLQWRENVRGFMGVCLAAMARAQLPVITADALRALPTVQDIMAGESPAVSSLESNLGTDPADDYAAVLLDRGVSLNEALDRVRDAYLKKLFSTAKGSTIAKLARRSGIPETTIRRKLEEYKVEL